MEIEDQRLCPTCGRLKRLTEFRPGRRPCKQCEWKAPRKDPKNGEMKACAVCGKPFYALASRLKAGNAQYCSRVCAWSDRHRKGEYRICKTCGKTFYLYPSLLKRPQRTGEYCSNKCKGPAISAAKKGKPRTAEAKAKQSAAMKGHEPWNRGSGWPDTTLICLYCGEAFVVSGRDHHRIGLARFCSTACWYSYLRAHPDEHPGYRGGVELYLGPNMLQQANLARERDSHMCQDCGKRQRRPHLDIHHLLSRRFFNGDYVAMNQLENLITLCKSCHTKREAIITRELAQTG